MTGRRALLLIFLLTLPLVTPKVRGADEIQYFSHLRSLAFDQDVDFENEYGWFVAHDLQGLAAFRETFLERRETATGRPINFTPIGCALLWSPFYVLAHVGVLVAHAVGHAVPADGFSRPYQAAACYGSAVYGFLGLLLLHDVLKRRFAEPAATWAAAAVWLASPLLYYMSLAPGFSHANSVFAVSLLLWLALRARESGRLSDWAIAGVAGGLAGLIREQDALFLVIPAVLIASSGTGVERRLKALAALGATSALCFAPQLLVYHATNGSFAPSKLVTRKMSWASPHALETLFDPAHGLYFWSPLLLLATLGLILQAWRRRDALSLVLFGAFLMQVWINGAVESWHQAGAFGSRRFVAATPLFAFGLAAMIQALDRRRAGLAAGLVLCAWWNVGLMVQFGLKLMDRQRLEWPRVAVNQFTEVPRRLGHTTRLFFTDRERLLRETP